MVSRIFTWVILIAFVLGIATLLIEPIVRWTSFSEVRLYVRLFLIMFALNTFAVLRLYNSIVQNTRFSIKLRESLIRFMGAIPGLERTIRSLSTSLGGVKSSTDSLKKSTDINSDKVETLSERINKFNSKN